MRLPKEWVTHIARGIVENLSRKELMKFKIPADEAVMQIEQIIIDDLMVEDRLDEEVKEILKQYEAEIEKGRLDYKKLFSLTKQKLIRERNLVV